MNNDQPKTTTNPLPSRTSKIEEFLLNPDKVVFQSLEEFQTAVDQLLDIFSAIDIENLELLEGEDGKTPVRGVDYFTEEDIAAFEQFILDKIPKIGVDLPSRLQMESYINDKVAAIPRIKGDQGPAGRDGQKGKDGSPDSAEDIVKKIRSLRDTNKALKIKDVRGLEKVLKQIIDEVDSIEQLKQRLDEWKIVMQPLSEGGGIGNDENAIHIDEANEFATVTEDASPEADSYFIYEAATGGAKFKIKFSDIGSGADGRTILNGTVDPTDEGVNGDFYLRTDTMVMFGPKAGGAWPAGVSLNGADGADGTNGTNGTDGVDGDSAYEIAVANGFVGDEAAWLASLVGDQGIQGEQGIQGIQGDQGIQGEQGIQGIQGNQGADGADSAYAIATVTAASTASLAVDTDTYNHAVLSAQAATLEIAAPTGTPIERQALTLRITASGTQTISWNAAFRAIGVTLPTSLADGKTLYAGALWNGTANKWDVTALAVQA